MLAYVLVGENSQIPRADSVSLMAAFMHDFRASEKESGGSNVSIDSQGAGQGITLKYFDMWLRH